MPRWLAGWNSAELGMAVAFNPNKPTPATFPDTLREQFGDRAAAAQEVYPASSEEGTLVSAAALASDQFIVYSTWKWIEYAFNTLDSKKGTAWEPEDRKTAQTMAAYWANFVRTGNPNGAGLADWPEYTQTGQVMYLDAVSEAGPEQDRARYEFLDGVVGSKTD